MRIDDNPVLRLNREFWNNHIRNYMECYQLANESEAARTLGITRGALNNFTRGHSPWPTALKIQLLDHVGYRLTSGMLIQLLPERAHLQFHEMDQKRINIRRDRARSARFDQLRSILSDLRASFSADEIEEVVCCLLDQLP